MSALLLQLARLRGATIGFFQRLPWFGWTIWIAVCVILVAQTFPARFASTFSVYLEYAARFRAQEQVYDATTLDGFNYWLVSLIAYRPFLAFDPVTAAMIALALSAVLLSLACVALMQALLPEPHARNALAISGIVLLINLPAAWFNFKNVQAQILMTAAMMFAAAAMMRMRWQLAAFWIFVAAVIKPLALVMLLLCAAVKARMRIALAAALLAGVLLPFLFADPGYVAAQYRLWAEKLWHMGTVMPKDWPYQADFQTMLDSVGIVPPRPAIAGIRLLAALGTLALAWRVSQIESRAVFPMAVLLLSACYINLFGPRNEFLSFLVLTPALTALALLLLLRDVNDRRAWLLILAALVLGMVWKLAFDRVAKPAIVTAIYTWLTWLTLVPQRWRDLIEGPAKASG